MKASNIVLMTNSKEVFSLNIGLSIGYKTVFQRAAMNEEECQHHAIHSGWSSTFEHTQIV